MSERDKKWDAEWAENAKHHQLQAAASDMLAALQAAEPLMIPGMNWTDEVGILVKSMVSAAITKAIGPR